MSASEAIVPEDHLSVKEFAQRSGISEKSVHRYLKSGRLPKYQPGGTNCRVSIPRSALSVMAKPEVEDAAAAAVSGPSATVPTPEAPAITPATTRPLPPPSWMRYGRRP